MSFPVNGVLDSFTRANASTLGSNWTLSTNAAIWGNDTLGIISNAAYDVQDVNFGCAFWNVSSYSGTLEAYVTITADIASAYYTGLCFATSLTAYTGYELFVNTSASNLIEIWRASPTNQTRIKFVNQTLSNGDSVGFTLDTSGNFNIYYQSVSGGGWQNLGSLNDTTYSCSYIGIQLTNSSAVRLTNFGGGTQNGLNVTVNVGTCSITSSALTATGVGNNATVYLSSPVAITSIAILTARAYTAFPSVLSITSQALSVNINIRYIPKYAVKIVSYNPLIFISEDIIPTITKVATTGPDSPTWVTTQLTGLSGVASVAVDATNGWIYVSGNNGLVAKLNISNLLSYSIINLNDTNNLLTMDANPNYYVAYTSDNSVAGEAFIIDSRITAIINTNFYALAFYGGLINTYLQCIKAKSINTNFVCIGNYSVGVNTNLVVLTENYNAIAPIGRLNWVIYIDGVQLQNTDLDLSSITIIHGAQSLFQKSRATFTLARRHDALNTTYSGSTVTITNQNAVTIYINGNLEFSGQIAQLNSIYEKNKDMVEVTAYMPQPTPQYNLVTLPLPGLTEKLSLYHVLMENPRIYNPYINPDDQAPEKYLGVKVRLGEWVVEHISQNSSTAQYDPTDLATAITSGQWFPTQNYTYFWFIDAETITLNLNSSSDATQVNVGTGSILPDPSGQYPSLNNAYVGTSLGGLGSRPYQLNQVNFKSQRDQPNEFFHLGAGTITQLDLETLYPGYGATLFNAITKYGYVSGTTITQKFQSSIYPAPATVTLSGVVSGSIAGFGLNLGGYNSYFYIALGPDLTQRAYNALIDALGYSLGNPPYKTVSARNGIYEAALRYTDGPDGFYQTQNAGYNFQGYDQLVANVEYQKMLTINGYVLPVTTANFELTLDAYYFYGIKLLTRINVSNTTTPNIFNNNNGFPLEVKTITLSSASMTVKLETGNEKSAIELQALDAQLPLTDDYIYPGQSILLTPKYDLQNQVTVT